jgi:hypothetical protein
VLLLYPIRGGFGLYSGLRTKQQFADGTVQLTVVI